MESWHMIESILRGNAYYFVLGAVSSWIVMWAFDGCMGRWRRRRMTRWVREMDRRRNGIKW